MLNFSICFKTRMSVNLGADLEWLACRVQTGWTRTKHATGITKPRKRWAIQQVSIDPRNLGRHVGPNAERAAGQLIDQFKSHRLGVLSCPSQQRLEVLKHWWHDKFIAVYAKIIENQTSQIFNLARLGWQDIGDIFGKKPIRHRKINQKKFPHQHSLARGT